MTRVEFLKVYSDYNTECWGPRCPVPGPGCVVCIAWALYDTVAMTLFEDDNLEDVRRDIHVDHPDPSNP